ncbi:F-box domain-containing protein [Dioscorea alata]|uniref:F-box domain-containing protein n=1 Tax=Dioscorea alata TaxID=55571 RepID=A0ACB7VWW9_DIOAL|nr:F-box domain-containing protein [Dioscorea alata]
MNLQREPPWESLQQIAQFLDPKSLAMSSCVSKLWHEAMSSNHLWKPFLSSHYPSSLHLISNTTSHHSLFSLLRNSSSRRRHQLTPPPPRISLHELFFAVDLFCGDERVVSQGKLASEFEVDKGGIFRFGYEVGGEGKEGEWRVVWVVVMEGCLKAFTVIERVDKGRVVGGNGLWFSEELPGGGCCVGVGGGGGLVGEVGLEFYSDVEGGGRKMVRVRLGVLSVIGCRYVSLDDGLRYLEHFLL